jgi:RHS repeat-associated protein
VQSVYDQVGSLRLVIDSSGEVQRRIDYDTFGYVTGDTNQALDVPFGFAGGLYDPETRSCRFGYRDYDTETGRWTAKDPIFFAGGDTNLYGYCVGDPVNWVDDVGLKAGDWWDIPSNFKRARDIGLEELKKRPMNHNDSGDAMRHAEWNRRMVEEINSFTAWTVGIGHEIEGLLQNQPWEEAMMDLHNNAEGRKAGNENRSVDSNDLITSLKETSKYNPYSKKRARPCK